MVVRSSLLSEVNSFLLGQENIAAQKKIIELNLDFAERIRSFIPRVIAQRLENYVEKERMTVLEASIEVLAPRKMDVACLFSDIRDFTQGSKELDEFISQSVIPEVKACSDAIEDQHGIPRKIGDLIFAYFDDQNIETNLLRAVTSGMEIAKLNHDMNATSSSVNIKRYVLISCGEAIVGNIGGLDSSIEITALGSTVNYLSRVDELTKHEKIQCRLGPGDLVLCDRSSEVLGRLAPDIEQNRIDLCNLNIRDFPEVRSIYCVKPTDANHAAVNAAYRRNREDKHGVKGKSRQFSA
jgi:class 3 adenylate cyclase